MMRTFYEICYDAKGNYRIVKFDGSTGLYRVQIVFSSGHLSTDHKSFWTIGRKLIDVEALSLCATLIYGSADYTKNFCSLIRNAHRLQTAQIAGVAS